MVVAIVILFGLPAILLFVWNYDNSRKIDRQLVKIRAAGQPTNYPELEEFYRLPSGVNDSTELWLRGLQAVADTDLSTSKRNLALLGEATPTPPGTTWPDLAEAEKLLEQHAFALSEFHAAAEMGGAARYPVKMSDGFEARLDHAQHLRSAVRLLSLEAYVRGHRGDAAGCAKSIRASFAARRSLEREPYVISHLVCVALHRMTIVTMANLLATVPFTEDDLHSFQQEVRSFDSRAGLQRGIIGDRVMGCEGYLNGTVSAGGTRLPFFKADFSMYLELFDEFLKGTEQDFPECLAAGAAFDQKLKSEVSSPVKKLSHVVTAQITPAISSALSASAQSASDSVLAETAIAVERFRRKHGRLPQSLPELVPAFLPGVPKDPFDGQAIRFKHRDRGFVLYSVGQDRKDDGGNGETNLDNVLDVPLPPG